MTIRFKTFTAAVVLAAATVPSVAHSDNGESILANTIGRILIKNTVGNPVNSRIEQDVRRIIRNPDATVDRHTRPDMVAEHIRQYESNRRLEQLKQEQRNRHR